MRRWKNISYDSVCFTKGMVYRESHLSDGFIGLIDDLGNERSIRDSYVHLNFVLVEGNEGGVDHNTGVIEATIASLEANIQFLKQLLNRGDR